MSASIDSLQPSPGNSGPAPGATPPINVVPDSPPGPDLDRHPLSIAWGDMPRHAFAALVDSVGSSANAVEVTLFGGQVLDGWHRYQAALSVGASISFTAYTGVDPVAFVIQANGTRRHLSATQRAAAMIRCYEWRRRGRPTKSAQWAEYQENSTVPAEQDIAYATGLSLRSVQRLKAAERAGLGGRVISGELTARKADQLANPTQANGNGRKIANKSVELRRTTTERDDLVREVIAKGQRISELKSELDIMRERNAFLIWLILTLMISTGESRQSGDSGREQHHIPTPPKQLRLFEDEAGPSPIDECALRGMERTAFGADPDDRVTE